MDFNLNTNSDSTINFCTQDNCWIMKIQKINGVNRILFNTEKYPNLCEDDFAIKVIDILVNSRLLDNFIKKEAGLIKELPDKTFISDGERRVWISVKERLPKEDENVLFYDGKEIRCGYLHLFEYYAGNKLEWDTNCYWDGWECNRGEYNPSHWMPLPPPPTI